MRIIEEAGPKYKLVKYIDTSWGEVFWTQAYGVCIRTEHGPVNLYDGQRRPSLEQSVEVVVCDATLYWKKTIQHD